MAVAYEVKSPEATDGTAQAAVPDTEQVLPKGVRQHLQPQASPLPSSGSGRTFWPLSSGSCCALSLQRLSFHLCHSGVLSKHLEPLTLRPAEGKAGEKRSLRSLRRKVGRQPRGPTAVRRGVASNRRKASEKPSLSHRRTLPKACVRPPGPSCTHRALRHQFLVGGCGTVGSYEREDKPDRGHLCIEDEAELRP